MFLHDESTAHLAHKTTSHLDKRDSLYENTDQKNSCDSDQNKKNLKGWLFNAWKLCKIPHANELKP